MGFYQAEPCTSAQAVYVWTGLNEPGHFVVEVECEVRNYTSGIQLVRDPQFVGGLKVDVMGWTGPLGPGTRPYKVSGTFSGMYVPNIIVACANDTHVVPVKEIPHDEAEAYLKKRAKTAAAAP